MTTRTHILLFALSFTALVCSLGSHAAQASGLSEPRQAVAGRGELVVFPPVVELEGRDARQQVLVTRRVRTEDMAAGALTEQDITRVARYETTDRSIAVVDAAGVVEPRGTGQTELIVRVEEAVARVPIRIESGHRYLPLDFERDIVPILTRRGCNGGGCHGKSTGKGGFQLSLFGYNPEADYLWITRDAAGRRITPQNPAASLLLLKPCMAVPHGGGRRLQEGEPEYQRLLRWIADNAPAARSPSDDPHTARLERLELEPSLRSLRPRDQQQMVATAWFTDGRRRDVTRLVEFRTNDSTIADVDQWGLVTAGDHVGETAIVAIYAGQVAVSRLRVPLARAWSDPDFPIENFVDEHVLAKLESLSMPPSPVCDDGTFVRRATQQIAGRLPTVEELSAFRAETSSNKRMALVRRLLDDPGYADHFAQKWSAILRNKRRGQSPRIPGTIAFHRWIRNAIAENVPYDQFVRDIITATGHVNVNPPAQWYAEVRYLDRYVDDTSQVFLGMRIGCARCHHHPFETISQRDYYGIAAFFARVDRKGGTGVAERRANETVFVKPTGTVTHPLTDDVVPPHGLGQADLQIADFVDPRHQLVDWMTEPDNPYFARAFVNRMWAHFFGRGLVDPLDDLRVTNPASNPALLDALARDFVDSGFDMRHIVERICSSTTWQLSCEPNAFNLRETQNFSRFYPQRLSAEVLLDAIDQVTGAATGYRGLPPGTRALQLPDEDYSNTFLTLFGRPPRESACECERVAEPSLSQSLHVMNDDFILGKVNAKGGLAARLAQDERPHADRVHDLFRIVFSREPTGSELADAVGYLNSESDAKKAYANLLWALINTKEFQFVH